MAFGCRGLSSAAGGKQPASGISASSKENKDLNGDTRPGPSGAADVAAAPEPRSVYVELADMAAADFKSLGRSYQVLQLLLCPQRPGPSDVMMSL